MAPVLHKIMRRICFGCSVAIFITCVIAAVPSCDPAEDGTCSIDVQSEGPLSELEKLLAGGLHSGGHVWPGPVRGSPCVASGAPLQPGDGKVADDCMLLLTHHRVIRYCADSDTAVVLQEAFGARFRGAIPARSQPANLAWILASPIGETAKEAVAADELWEIDLALPLGESRPRPPRRRVGIPNTGDAHDMIRVRDDVWIVDTKHGALVEGELPGAQDTKSAMLVVRKRHQHWRPRDHLNQIAWAMAPIASDGRGVSHVLTNLHKKNLHGAVDNSEVHVLDARQGKISMQVPGMGSGSHGLSAWRDCTGDGSAYLVNLDSNNGGLGLKHMATGRYVVVWTPSGKNLFTKGLAVIGNVAYFGLSQKYKGLQGRLRAVVALVAVDLVAAAKVFRDGSGQFVSPLWQRQLPFDGLLNQIVGPSSLPLPVNGAAVRSRHDLLNVPEASDRAARGSA